MSKLGISFALNRNNKSILPFFAIKTDDKNNDVVFLYKVVSTLFLN